MHQLVCYDKEQRKEYKTILLAHYDLLKNEKAVMLGQRGGQSTQRGIRSIKEENKKLCGENE